MESDEVRKNKIFQRGRGSDAAHRADEALFEELLKRNNEIERVTQTIENGIESTTRIISKDSKLIATLQEHVVGMKKRFDENRAIRSWDPLFVELFDHRKELHIAWEMLEDGIKVRLTTNTPQLVELLFKHDETLHSFITYGYQAARYESPYCHKS